MRSAPIAALGPKVSPETIHERNMHLRALGERKKAAFHERMIGTEQRVLVLNQRLGNQAPPPGCDGPPPAARGRLVGLSGNYLEILLHGDDSLMNEFAWARVDRFLEDGRAEGTLVRTEGC